MPYLRVSNVSKAFNGHKVLDKVSLDMEKGDILCLLGPSGCGKTTLLRIIAGLDQPDEGELQSDHSDILNTPAHQRQIRMMFQEFALFPHKSVSENISFGLEILKKSQEEINNRTDEMLSLVGLDGFGDRKVDELSGGERQRLTIG